MERNAQSISMLSPSYLAMTQSGDFQRCIRNYIHIPYVGSHVVYSKVAPMLRRSEFMHAAGETLGHRKGHAGSDEEHALPGTTVGAENHKGICIAHACS